MVQKQNIYSDYDSVKAKLFSILILKKRQYNGNSFVAIDNAKITAASSICSSAINRDSK
jgi:hypothetical protein